MKALDLAPRHVGSTVRITRTRRKKTTFTVEGTLYAIEPQYSMWFEGDKPGLIKIVADVGGQRMNLNGSEDVELLEGGK